MTSWTARLPQLRKVYDRARNDPFLRGRAQATIGIALLADGFVGLDNPLAGRDRRPGVFGAAFTAVLGLLLVLMAGLFIHSSAPYPGGFTAQGTITAVQPQQSDGSSRTCSATITYSAAGTNHTIGSEESDSSLCTRVGQHVPVSWTTADPGAGRPQIAQTNWVLQGVRVLGWIVLTIGVLTFLLRVAELVVGAVLLVRGRRTARAASPTNVGQLLDDLRAAWSGTYIDGATAKPQ